MKEPVKFDSGPIRFCVEMDKNNFTCESVCGAVVAMLSAVEKEDLTTEYYSIGGRLVQSRVCETYGGGVNHYELLRRLQHYKLVLK